MKRILAALLLALAACAAWGQSNTQGTLIPSAAYTATVNSNDQDNAYYHGVTVVINVTVATAGNFTCTIQGKDPVSGNYYTILASGAISTVSTTVLKVFPGIAASANAAAQDILPRIWRLTCVGAASPNLTFSAGFMLEL